MSTSHDGRILDHLAGYILYLSTAPSFWFSLNSSHGHGFHLSKRFGMIPHVAVAVVVAVAVAVAVAVVVAVAVAVAVKTAAVEAAAV